MSRVALFFLGLTLVGPAASAQDLPARDKCLGTFYAITKYEHFNWANHFRVLSPDESKLKEGERLAFQATSESFGDDEFALLAGIEELEHLSLVGTSVTDEGLAVAKSMRALKSINIWMCRRVTNKGIGHFKDSSLISSASVGATNSVDDNWLSVLEFWPELKELRIDDTPLTGSGFANFKHTPKLEWIEGWNVFKINDSALTHIATLSELKGLTLWECRTTTSTGFQKLAACKNLMSLQLIDCAGVDDPFADVVSGFSKLEVLDLSYSKQLTDVGAKKFAKCKCLRELDLSDCESITDATVQNAAEIEGIVCLKLGDCPKITKKSLAEILKLKKLERIQVPPAFGDEEKAALKKNFPKIEFEIF